MNRPTDSELIRLLASTLDPRTRLHRSMLARLDGIAMRLDDLDAGRCPLPSSLVSSVGKDENSEGGQT